MTEAAHTEPEVKSDVPATEAEAVPAEKPQRAVSRPRKSARPQVSVAALAGGDKVTQDVVSAALFQGGFQSLAELRHYLGGATDQHALTWLALRTQAFTVGG